MSEGTGFMRFTSKSLFAKGKLPSYLDMIWLIPLRRPGRSRDVEWPLDRCGRTSISIIPEMDVGHPG